MELSPLLAQINIHLAWLQIRYDCKCVRQVEAAHVGGYVNSRIVILQNRKCAK